MSLIVNNVISSNLGVNYSYLETDELFGYVLTANYKINVSDTLFEADGGILLEGRSALRAAYERQNITARIAGDEFVNGLITNLSFEQSNLVGSEVASVTIVENKRLNDYSSSTFAKHIPSPHLLESFDETYSFSRQDSTYSYSRDISLKYSQDAGINFLNNAKIFLSNYYHKNRPSYGYYEDGISENAKFDKTFNGKLTENIDLINLSVSLNETFDSSLIDSSEEFAVKRTEKFSQASDGYLSKEINLEITSLRYDAQNIVESAISSLIDSIILEEESSFGKPHSIVKGITKDSRKGTLALIFSTNPNLSSTSTTTYTCEKVKNNADYLFNLNIKHKASGINLYDRYNKTIALWQSLKGGNETKVVSLFPEADGTIYETSRTCGISKSRGEVTETITFTTNSAYDSAGLSEGILKYSLTLNKTNKIPRTEKIIDLDGLKEKLVVSDYNALGQATVTATVVADPSHGIFHGKEFLHGKTSEMEAKISEASYYLSSDQYTIDLSNGTTTRVINFVIA